MKKSMNLHDVKNVRIERVFDELCSITLQIVGKDGEEFDLTLFDLPEHVRSKLRYALSDKRTWDDDDFEIMEAKRKAVDPAYSDIVSVADFVADDPTAA